MTAIIVGRSESLCLIMIGSELPRTADPRHSPAGWHDARVKLSNLHCESGRAGMAFARITAQQASQPHPPGQLTNVGCSSSQVFQDVIAVKTRKHIAPPTIWRPSAAVKVRSWWHYLHWEQVQRTLKCQEYVNIWIHQCGGGRHLALFNKLVHQRRISHKLRPT